MALAGLMAVGSAAVAHATPGNDTAVAIGGNGTTGGAGVDSDVAGGTSALTSAEADDLLGSRGLPF